MKLRRALAYSAIPIAIIAATAAVGWADVPNTFKAGDALSAQKMNADFADIDKWRSHPVITRNNKQYSLGATYCGTTAPTNGQITNGYAGAKGLCEALAACGNSPSAHMCTGEEIVRTKQLGISFPQEGWYSSGVQIFTPTRNFDDCDGWTKATNAFGGATSIPANGDPAQESCDLNTIGVLCCD